MLSLVAWRTRWLSAIAVVPLLLTAFLLIGSGPAQAAAGSFRNPVGTGPDPFMTHFNGNYYLAMSENDSIRIRRAPSVAKLLNAPAIEVWRDSNPSRNRNVWAPEFYRFGNRWYLYYTADDGVDENHRLYVLESAGDDPAGPYHFKARLVPPNRDVFAIDAALMQHNGRLYVMWSGVNQYQHNGMNIARCRTRGPSRATRWRSTRPGTARRFARGRPFCTGPVGPG